MPDFDNHKKNMVRDAVFLQDKLSVSKAALLLPGPQLLCLKKGTDSGMFDPKTTTMLCVERDVVVAKRIERYLNTKGYSRYHVHQGDIKDFDDSTMRLALKGKQLDFAFLDFCSQMNNDLADWFVYQCKYVFAVGAEVAITYSLKGRNPRNLYLDAVDMDRLLPLLNITGNKEVNLDIIDTKFYGDYKDDWRRSVVAGWLAMGVNYTMQFKMIRCYTASKHPMVTFKVVIDSQKPSVPSECYLNTRLQKIAA